VFPGDTLFGIARAFNTTVAAISAVNDTAALAVIRDGDIVVLPAEARPITTDDVDTTTYVAKAGDTIIGIAKAAGRTPAQLLAINEKLDDPNTLAIGEVVLIPVFD
jgi:LysM repeat protein